MSVRGGPKPDSRRTSRAGRYLCRTLPNAGTALSPVTGYDKASAIAHKANDDNITLRQAALASGYITRG
jgi:fumarate hydratase class II